jgi:signal transduction histidine kinase
MSIKDLLSVAPPPKLQTEHRAVEATSTSLSPNSHIHLLSLSLVQSLEKLSSYLCTQVHDQDRSYIQIQDTLNQTNQALREKVVELEVISCYLNALLESIAQGLVQIRDDGIVTSYNTNAEKLLQIDRSQLLSSHYTHSLSDDLFGFSIAAALQGEHFPPSRITLHKRVIEVQMQQIEVRDISHKGVMFLLRDITQEEHWHRLALRNERLQELGEMAASLAHEIRNPLGGIEGFASLLAQDLKDSPLQEYARYITQGVHALNRLVSATLNYVHPLDLKLQKCYLHHLYQETLTLVQASAKTPTSITFTSIAPSQLMIVSIDKELIQSAIMNLIINSIQAVEVRCDASATKGSIQATFMLSEDNQAILCISDNGCGIPEEIKESIFSPFFTTKPSGTGLGLSQAYKIIQSHGGSIQILSNKSGGTDALLSLPLHPHS